MYCGRELDNSRYIVHESDNNIVYKYCSKPCCEMGHQAHVDERKQVLIQDAWSDVYDALHDLLSELEGGDIDFTYDDFIGNYPNLLNHSYFLNKLIKKGELK